MTRWAWRIVSDLAGPNIEFVPLMDTVAFIVETGLVLPQ
jgi:hypothetical protein